MAIVPRALANSTGNASGQAVWCRVTYTRRGLPLPQRNNNCVGAFGGFAAPLA
jgi:hypothetical protein